MNRRQFLRLTAAATFINAGRAGWSSETDARVEILPDQPIGRIAPEIYGHFAEHLGGVIYDGVWVGEDSKIANIGGIRRALIERLRQIRAPVIRWPGGCFADSYDWEDGVGPRRSRPTRTNFWADSADIAKFGPHSRQLYEDNQFGTDEFIRFCRLCGAEPYLAANLRSLPAQDFVRWVEYCNSPADSTTLARARAANGAALPYDVRFWGIGNESWGCGGNFTPEEYAAEFRRFTSFIPAYGKKLTLIGAGPGGNDLDWTRRFFEALQRKTGYSPQMSGWSVHHYVDDLGHGKGDALAFDQAEWDETLRRGLRTEQIITSQWALIGEFDPEHRVKLVVDEYGAWYRPGSELDPTHILGQQSTLRDAVLTAMTLDIFNRHADKVAMANCAQLVNCLNALFFAHEDRFILSPVFHVFDLYKAHQGAQALACEWEGALGSASRNGDRICVTMANAQADRPLRIEIALRGGRIGAAQGRVLGNGDMHAHNSFEQPEIVHPLPLTIEHSGGRLIANLPAAGVAKIDIATAI
jgi:alpha-N-arabinofuranosidase